MPTLTREGGSGDSSHSPSAYSRSNGGVKAPGGKSEGGARETFIIAQESYTERRTAKGKEGVMEQLFYFLDPTLGLALIPELENSIRSGPTNFLFASDLAFFLRRI